jgi:hypothetical protein
MPLGAGGYCGSLNEQTISRMCITSPFYLRGGKKARTIESVFTHGEGQRPLPYRPEIGIVSSSASPKKPRIEYQKVY